jgi:hypothetical protein
VWFWITMTFLAALHPALIVFVPWTTKRIPAVVIAPFGIADCTQCSRFFQLWGKFVGEPMAGGSKHRRSGKLRQSQDA